MEISPIAVFRSPFDGKFGVPRQSGLAPTLRGRIVFNPPYRDPESLRGLEGFSHIWIIWEFSLNRTSTDTPSFQRDKTWSPTVRPPRLGGNQRMGVFATRSPFRPNSLGLSCVEVESIEKTSSEGTVINVLGADICDGTPIYDIKPYIPYTDCHKDASGGFTSDSEWKPLCVDFPENLKKEFARKAKAPDGGKAGDDIPALVDTLSCDPRPRYQDDPEREYGMTFDGVDVRFKVSDGKLTVTAIEKVPKPKPTEI